MANEIHEIMDQHPEIIYFPWSKTWKGMLVVRSLLDPNERERLKIHLNVPNYPKLDEAKLYIDSKVFNRTHRKEISKFFHTATSVSALLIEIQNFFDSSSTFGRNIPQDDEFSLGDTINAVHDLRQVLSDSNVKISSSRRLERIAIKAKNVSMTLKRSQRTWTIISSGLPSALEFQVNKNDDLQEIAHRFLENAKLVDAVLEQLREIDEKCHVIDPVNPQPHHLYRRIYLDESVSVVCTVNPLNMEKPQISLLGSESMTAQWQKMMTEKLDDWNPDDTLYENLKWLFNIECFSKPTKNTEQFTDEAIVADEECCICYSLESEDGQVPDKVCSNRSCRVNFHSSCLFQWLSSVPDNKVMFNQIQGSCPNCSEKIECSSYF